MISLRSKIHSSETARRYRGSNWMGTTVSPSFSWSFLSNASDMAVEEEFGCEIPDDAAEKILTIKDAISFIESADG